MPIKPSEYRARMQKLVVAPSGAEFLIRAIKGIDFVFRENMPIRDLLNQETDENYTPTIEDIVARKKIIDEIICEGVVEPRIVMKKPHECNEEELSISELSDEDTLFLYQEIMKMAGYKVDMPEGVTPFPARSNATASGHNGEEVPQAAN